MGRRSDSPRALSLLLALNNARRRGDAAFATDLANRLEHRDLSHGYWPAKRFDVVPKDNPRRERDRIRRAEARRRAKANAL